MPHTTTASVFVGGHQTIIPVSVGSGHTTTANVIVGGGHTTTAAVTVGHQATASVLVEAPIVLSPNTLTFAHPGSPVQSIAISQGSLSGPYTGSSSDNSIATVVISGNTALVSAVAEGSVTITITDPNSVSAMASVSVGAPAGGIVLSATTLYETIGTAQTFSATRTGDTGAFSVASIPVGIVSVIGSGNAPGPITYTVTPVSVGQATVTVSATDGSTSSLQVIVSGTITAAVTSPKHSSSLVIAVSELGYSGTITPSFVGSTSANIAPSVGQGPRTSFIINDPTAGETFLIQFADSSGNTTTLSLQSRNVSLGSVSFVFYDETGVSPVAPGVQYQVYYDGDPQIASNVVANGYLGVAGTATLSLDELTDYVIVWIGQQAPRSQTIFTTGAIGISSQTVVVTQYRSPNLSTLGYAIEQTSRWTRGWAGDEFKQPGDPGTTGVAYNLAYSFAAMLGEGASVSGTAIAGFDTFLQQTIVSTRLFNCVGSSIDTWFQDFLGPNFNRQIGESDSAFLARGLIAISQEVVTRDAVTKAANAAWQTLGNQGNVICDDDMSNPSLMEQIGYHAPHFIVVLPPISTITDAFFLDDRYMGINDFLLSLGTLQILTTDEAPPIIVDAVESKRALGTIPIYGEMIV